MLNVTIFTQNHTFTASDEHKCPHKVTDIHNNAGKRKISPENPEWNHEHTCHLSLYLCLSIPQINAINYQKEK